MFQASLFDLNGVYGLGQIVWVRDMGLAGLRGRVAVCQTLGVFGDQAGVVMAASQTDFDGPADAFGGMPAEQLQHADEMTRCRVAGQSLFQFRTEFAKRRRKLQIAVDIGMVQHGGLLQQNAQVMQWIEHLGVTLVTAWVRGDDVVLIDNVDAFDVRLDRHFAKRIRTRYGVPVGIMANGLVFIDRSFMANTGIKTPLG